MEQFKKIWKRIVFLPPLPTVLISVPSFIFVFVMLARGEHSLLSYVSYILSAYALIITATGISSIIAAVKRGIDGWPLLKKMQSNPLGRRLLGDSVFRSEVILHGGLVINLMYAAMNLFYGARYRSAWFAALAGIVIYMVNQNRVFTYPGFLIYAMAAYTFYITIAAIVNVIKYRRRGSPILSAAKIISLTAALVSMLSLETAMLTQFGADQPGFRRIMTSASGGAVCTVVFGMAIYMIVRAEKNRKDRRKMQ